MHVNSSAANRKEKLRIVTNWITGQHGAPDPNLWNVALRVRARQNSDWFTVVVSIRRDARLASYFGKAIQACRFRGERRRSLPVVASIKRGL